MKRYLQEHGLNLLAPLLLCIFAFAETDRILYTGLDGAYQWALNELFANHFSQLAKTHFPHGPLGFLLFIKNIGSNWWIGHALLFPSWYALGWTFFQLTGHGNNWQRLAWLPVFAFGMAFIKIEHAFPLIVFGNLMLMDTGRDKLHGSLAIVFTILAAYVKTTAGIASFGMLLVWTIYSFREGKRSNWIRYMLPGAIGGCLLLWLILFQNPVLLVDYLHGKIDIALGHDQAMVMDAANNWMLLFSALVIWFIFPYVMKEPRLRKAWWILLPAAFVAWKHGMVRQDYYHYMHFLRFMIAALPLLVLVAASDTIKTVLATILIAVLLYANMSSFTDKRPAFFAGLGPKHFAGIFDPGIPDLPLERVYEPAGSNVRLPKGWRTVMSTNTVDALPYDLNWMGYNPVNWQPRPVMQGYMAFTPFLQKQNFDHFRSKNAPKNIVWHYPDPERPYNTFDDRYLFHQESKMWLQIMGDYDLIEMDSGRSIWQRKPAAVVLSKTGFGKDLQEVDMGLWVGLPATETDIFTARIEFSFPLLYRIKSFLYKPEPFYIEFQLGNEEIRRHRFVPGTAEDEIWLTPYLQDQDMTWAPKRFRIYSETNPGKFSVSYKLNRFGG